MVTTGDHQLADRRDGHEQQGEHQGGRGEVANPQPYGSGASVDQRGRQPTGEPEEQQGDPANRSELLGQLDGEQEEQAGHHSQVRDPAKAAAGRSDQGLTRPQGQRRAEHGQRDQYQDVGRAGTAEQEEVRTATGHVEQGLGDHEPAEDEQLEKAPELGSQPRR
jgi:hypothetical protein